MKKNYLLTLVFVGVIFTSGCSMTQTSAAKNTWLGLSGSFEAAQIVMSSRMDSLSTTQDEKNLYMRISQEGTNYLKAAKTYIDEGKFDDWQRTSTTISQLLGYVRPLLIEKISGNNGTVEGAN